MLSFMAAMSWYIAALIIVSIGAIMPYCSAPCSITNRSITSGSNIMAFGVTSNTPFTTPCNNKKHLINIRVSTYKQLITIYTFNKLFQLKSPVNNFFIYLSICDMLNSDFDKSFVTFLVQFLSRL